MLSADLPRPDSTDRARGDQGFAERRPLVMRDVEWPVAGAESRWMDGHITPVASGDGGDLLGATVSFADVSAPKRLQRDLVRTKQELESAYEELRSTNEELETTNEELQSTVEELETTNEEVQSTNEELEMRNEELQSTNEELRTMNDDLRQRSDELTQVNAFLESILTSLQRAVVVVDENLHVLVWNGAAEELWGLRDEEVRGKRLLGLDVGLPVERLEKPIRSCLDGSKPVVSLELEAVNRRGRPMQCAVTVTPLMTPAQTIRGAIVLMEDRAAPEKRAAARGPKGNGAA